MKVRLDIDDGLLERAGDESDRQGRSLSSLVEEAIRRYLGLESEPQAPLEPLPVYRSGGRLVDIADRDALYDLFDSDPDRPAALF